MNVNADSLGRIAKLLVDQHDVSLEEARQQLDGFRLAITCGPEVQHSRTLQAALLTAANIACRCFPSNVRIIGIETSQPCLLRGGVSTLGDALSEIGASEVLRDDGVAWRGAPSIALGSARASAEGVQVTFDGWTCAVSSMYERVRLAEREGCVLAGIAAGALAVSEIFLGHFGFDIEAGGRSVGLSLWRPELPWDSKDAAGSDCPLRFLPQAAWLIGLGHLGQAYAWSLSLLPFSVPRDVDFILQDFDRIVPANLDTGLATCRGDVGRLKTRVVSDFLEAKGFVTRCVERHFDEHTQPRTDEPRVALSGMDGHGPRNILDCVGFETVIDCGVGGNAANFDSITLNVLPQSNRRAAEIWPSDQAALVRRNQEAKRLAENRKLYRTVQQQHACGHVELAGRAVAVPFVGAIASALAIAELARRIHRVHRYESMHVRLSSLSNVHTRKVDEKSSGKRPRLSFQEANS